MNHQFEIPLDLPVLGLQDFIRVATRRASQIKFYTKESTEYAMTQNYYEIRGLFSVEQFSLGRIPNLKIYMLHPDRTGGARNNCFLSPDESKQLYELMAGLHAARKSTRYRSKNH
ncbi:hypothetical protein HDR63_01220 [bacterium]|nr:hypothetical protein [bacterium]